MLVKFSIRKTCVRSLAVVGIAVATTAFSQALLQPIQIDAGKVQGQTDALHADVTSFLGIPYAAAPTGENRWRDPQPAASWSNTLAAASFGKSCIQPPAALPLLEVGPQSEDCLFLNVWTAAHATSERLPVMVFVHGGSYTSGSGGLYNGSTLATKGAVVVSFNYRLGPFGFMTHRDTANEGTRQSIGNYALADHIAALKWVQHNIASFGGDPNRVTIFGQSAGGDAVSRLLVSPAARGLFHRAIAESGAPSAGEITPEKAAIDGDKFAELLNCKNARQPVECLRQVPADKILATANEVSFGPINDGVIVTDNSREAFEAGAETQVPLMAGINKNEYLLFLRPTIIWGVAQYKSILKDQFGEDMAQRVFDAYPATSILDAKDALGRAATAAFFTEPMHNMVQSSARHGVATYQYHFSRISDYAKTYKSGAFHGLELFYLWGWLDQQQGFAPVDTKLADAMQSYWVNFAASGDPNIGPAANAALPVWPRVDAAESYLELGDTISANDHLCDTTHSECEMFSEWENASH